MTTCRIMLSDDFNISSFASLKVKSSNCSCTLSLVLQITESTISFGIIGLRRITASRHFVNSAYDLPNVIFVLTTIELFPFSPYPLTRIFANRFVEHLSILLFMFKIIITYSILFFILEQVIKSYFSDNKIIIIIMN